MFTRRTSAKAEGKGKTQGHYRQKPPALHLFRRHRAGFFPGPSWPHPEPPDHYRFLHISSGDTAPHYAFCARAHSLMESSVWHGREQEATNSLQDWSIKATIKVLGGGGVGEETLFQKGPSPTKLCSRSRSRQNSRRKLRSRNRRARRFRQELQPRLRRRRRPGPRQRRQP